ncbi:MAG: hypothetical protein HYU58_03195 [Proteobacteria bacterium]|nr:hypothetical protein [Pseudomonadota bacterium]
MSHANRIFAALRVQRLTVGLLLVPLLVLNLIVSGIASSREAEARALDDVLTQSRCLTESDMAAPSKAPAQPGKERPCPSCATACATGCCAGPDLWGARMTVEPRAFAAGLDTAHCPSAQQANPLIFRPAARAHAPPRARHYQSIAA